MATLRAKSGAEVAYQAVRTVLSLPHDVPLQLRGTLDDDPENVVRFCLGGVEKTRRERRLRPGIRSRRQRCAERERTDQRNGEAKPVPGGRRSSAEPGRQS